jgi:competence protein ComEA
MKRKTLKNKSCYVVILMLSSALFLTGLTGCKSREAQFLIEGFQEAKAEVDAESSDPKTSDKETSDKKSLDVTDNQKDDRNSQKPGTEDSDSMDSGSTDDSEGNDTGNTGISNAEMQQERIYVDVCGAVANPGVFELAAGSRVFQAIEAAGGYLPEAVENCVNRAGVLTDGQQLYILTREEMEQQGMSQAELANASNVSGSGNSRNTEAVSSGQQDNRININTADEAQLTTLTGIGATRAQAIIAYREENGPFAVIEDIMNVQGIKEGTFAKIKDEIVVG